MTGRPNAAELEMLTEEERDGLLDEDFVDEGQEEGEGEGEGGDDTDTAEADAAAAAAAKAVADAAAAAAEAEAANGDGTQAEEKKPVVEAEKKPDTAAADAAKAAADADAAAAAAKVEADKVAAARAEAQPDRKPAWVLPPEVETNIAALTEERIKLADQWDDGELTGKEFRIKVQEIEDKLDGLKEQRITANVAKANAIATYANVTIPTFFTNHEEYVKGGILYTMLDAELKRLQTTAADPLNPQLLETAHENIKSQVSKAYGVQAGEKKEEQKPTPKPAAASANAGRTVPPTLGTVPAADFTDADDGGEFAYLDRLSEGDVEKYETEIAKLSEEKRERYLAQ